MLQSLRKPGMRTRHWDQLTKDLGRDMHFDSSYTLDAALKQGLLAHLDQISEVSDVASKEYSIEQVSDLFLCAYITTPRPAARQLP